MNPPNAILHELLNLAEIMLTNGAEVSRVEETLNRMGHAYGATQMNVFAITSSIVVTMVFEEGEEYTQTRRITTPVGTDFFKLEQANALSRRCCSSPLSLPDLKDEINKISKITPAPYTIYLGSMLGAGGFSVFFGGTILDGAIAVIFCLSPLLFTKAFKLYMQQYFNPAVFLLPFCRLRHLCSCTFLSGNSCRQSYDRRHYAADSRNPYDKLYPRHFNRRHNFRRDASW